MIELPEATSSNGCGGIGTVPTDHAFGDFGSLDTEDISSSFLFEAWPTDAKQSPTNEQQPAIASQASWTQASRPHVSPDLSWRLNDTFEAWTCDVQEHSCVSVLSRLALEMHVAAKPCITAFLNFGGDSISDKLRPKHADKVLLRNRGAIKILSGCLDCPCSTEPSVILLACLLVSKIMAWYGAILATMNTDRSDPPKFMASCVTASPINVGSFPLGAEVARSIGARIVLSELQKYIDRILPKLPLCQLSTSKTADQGKTIVDRSLTALPPTQINQPNCALREQLRQVLAEANRETG